MDVYTHVIPGMDEAAANLVAALILGSPESRGDSAAGVAEVEGVVHKLVHNEPGESPEEDEEPADLERFRRSAGSSIRSGGRI